MIGVQLIEMFEHTPVIYHPSSGLSKQLYQYDLLVTENSQLFEFVF